MKTCSARMRLFGGHNGKREGEVIILARGGGVITMYIIMGGRT